MRIVNLDRTDKNRAYHEVTVVLNADEIGILDNCLCPSEGKEASKECLKLRAEMNMVRNLINYGMLDRFAIDTAAIYSGVVSNEYKEYRAIKELVDRGTLSPIHLEDAKTKFLESEFGEDKKEIVDE